MFTLHNLIKGYYYSNKRIYSCNDELFEIYSVHAILFVYIINDDCVLLIYKLCFRGFASHCNFNNLYNTLIGIHSIDRLYQRKLIGWFVGKNQCLKIIELQFNEQVIGDRLFTNSICTKSKILVMSIKIELALIFF